MAAILIALPAHAFTGQAQFLVTLRPQARSLEQIRALCQSHRLIPKYHNHVHGLLPVRISPGIAPRSLELILRGDERIESIEADQIVWIAGMAADPPRDTYFRSQWALYNPEHDRVDIHALEAWRICTGSKRIIAGILDTGIDYLHPDIIPNLWHNPGEIPRNGIDDDRNGYIDDTIGWNFVSVTAAPNSILGSADPMDGNSHGTHVAGIIGAAANNGRGIAGINHHVSLMALKGLSDAGWGFLSDLIAGIYYAVDNGANVINASWGGGGPSAALRDAIAYAAARNVIFVAAAGNSRRDNDREPFYPASYDLDNIIAVAATEISGNFASFSHTGATSVDITAPGKEIMSTIPGGDYASYTGTSMAAPQVTGAVALLASHAAGLPYLVYRSAILSSARRFPAATGKVASGGQLDLAAALQTIGPRRHPAAAALTYITNARRR